MGAANSRGTETSEEIDRVPVVLDNHHHMLESPDNVPRLSAELVVIIS